MVEQRCRLLFEVGAELFICEAHLTWESRSTGHHSDDVFEVVAGQEVLVSSGPQGLPLGRNVEGCLGDSTSP